MSRKGNCLDNAVAESFFGILKTEMYHGYEYKSVTELVSAIREYIEYYNHKRIKLKLKGLIPIAYRIGSRLEMSPTLWGHFNSRGFIL